MTPKTFVGRLKMARKIRGFTKSGLDARAGLTRGHVRQIESGLKSNPEAGTAAKLATALGVTLDWLIGGTGEPPAKESGATLSSPVARSA